MLKNIKLLLGMLFLLSFSLFAEEDIEKLFLRKAVKDYVAKNYTAAVSNLQQVLVANSENLKAQKLIVKCYVNLGTDALDKGEGSSARKYFKNVLKYDPQNSSAIDGLKQSEILISQRVTSKETDQSSQRVPSQTVIQPVAPQVVVAQPQSSKTDSVQAKVISNLFENFSAQQKLFEKQIEATSKAMVNTEDSKEKYLTALMANAEKSNAMMRNYLLVGAAVAGGILLLVIIVFLIIIFFVNRASNLRTVQANETLQLLLAGPSNESDGTPKLMIAGPSGSAPQQAHPTTSVSMESLKNEDPIQRANAVEAIAAEIVDEKEDARVEKIKKLEELLNDENNRVRANAAKAIYEIDKNMSLNTLRGMVENESKRMRASAVWALGEIASEEALKMILSLKEEDDEIVTFNIKVALGKIKTLNRFPITSEMGQEIETVLENYKDMV